MNLYVQIPLGKIQNRQSINKIELTNMDKHLTNEQKKRVAKFYREEAAKRTRYVIETRMDHTRLGPISCKIGSVGTHAGDHTNRDKRCISISARSRA